MKKSYRAILTGAALTMGGVSSGLAAILTNVPMQGTMVMPEISYNATDGALHVKVDPTVPQLTPLLVSNPGDGFNLCAAAGTGVKTGGWERDGEFGFNEA